MANINDKIVGLMPPAISQIFLHTAVFILYIWEKPYLSSAAIHPVFFILFTASIAVNIFVFARMVLLYKRSTRPESQRAMTGGPAGRARAGNMDFIDQLQEITRLTREDRIEELGAYLEGINGRLELINNIRMVDNPIIGALLKAKAAEGNKRGIRLEMNISVSLSALGPTALDVGRILGNLIDNAFDALESVEEGRRTVLLEINSAGPLLELSVCNPGKVDSHFIKNIFIPGYSTKGAGHSGLGLYIVKSLAEKLRGHVLLKQDEANNTKFIVNLPV
ncbi:MAG: sensor histidine kinase [Bacillota bacterium]